MYSIKLYSMPSSSGTYVVYLDNIDALAATDKMPGAVSCKCIYITYYHVRIKK